MKMQKTTGFPVVWLTDVPTLEVSLEVRREMLKRGIVCGPRYKEPAGRDCLHQDDNFNE